jgi:hypothetical protein
MVHDLLNNATKGAHQRKKMELGHVVNIKEVRLKRKPSIEWEPIRKVCHQLKPNQAYVLSVPKGTTRAQFAWQVRTAFRKTANKFRINTTKDNHIAISKKY